VQVIEEWTVPVPQAGSVDLSGWGTLAGVSAPGVARHGGAGEWVVPAPVPAQAAAPAEDWIAPPAKPPAAPVWAPPNRAYDPMEPDPAPGPAFAPGEAPFATLAPGQELASGDEDLLVPIDPAEETATTPIRPEAPPPGAGELWVPGEHRVAVHTREGGTRRGIVRNVDLSASSFPLLPQGGRSAVQVPAAEVKAIFFMLGPGEKLAPAGGAPIRVIFLDGRSIEGTRDSGDAPKGFFLVPSDAARTSTRRVFVVRDATKSVV
jgi:hypothetical protein